MNEQTHPTISYGKLTAVWLMLLALTALTVWVARHNVGIGGPIRGFFRTDYSYADPTGLLA